MRIAIAAYEVSKPFGLTCLVQVRRTSVHHCSSVHDGDQTVQLIEVKCQHPTLLLLQRAPPQCSGAVMCLGGAST